MLDFQDAVRGPITYDLVSLLGLLHRAGRRTRVDAWLEHYHQRAADAGLPVPPPNTSAATST